MSQEYIASFSRGDQSSSPFLHPSLMAEMSDPVICDNLFCSGVADVSDRSAASCRQIFLPTIFFPYAISVHLHPLDKKSHPLHRLSTKWSMKGSNLKSSLDIAIKIPGHRVPLQLAIFRLLHAIQSLP